MQQEQFGSLLRHLLANIHDHAVLEKHPLNELFPRPDASASRAGHLRRKIAVAIEMLKPQHIPFDVSTTEWRYYLILYGRYVEGANLIELQTTWLWVNAKNGVCICAPSRCLRQFSTSRPPAAPGAEAAPRTTTDASVSTAHARMIQMAPGAMRWTWDWINDWTTNMARPPFSGSS